MKMKIELSADLAEMKCYSTHRLCASHGSSGRKATPDFLGSPGVMSKPWERKYEKENNH